MQIISNEDFNNAYSIMVSNFPEDERRSYEAQKSLFAEKNYYLKVEKDERDNIIALISYWMFDDFIFIEHLAVCDEYKGKGLGSAILKQFIQQSNLPVIAEIEPPQITETATRRWLFYERLGFNLNLYEYFQPPYKKTKKAVELKISSYPKSLSQQEFEKVKNTLYKKIYHTGE